jgi:hypothetical protein
MIWVSFKWGAVRANEQYRIKAIVLVVFGGGIVVVWVYGS